MDTASIKIRRYPNRRFYDRSQRCYVTLGDIEQLVREGKTVEVRESRTNVDITRQILTQILLERHPDKMECFPPAMMHGLLRANDLATELWRAYLRRSMQAFEGLHQTEANPGVPSPWLSFLLPGVSPPPPPSTPSETLVSRLAALEQRIGRLEGSATHASDGGNDDLERLEDRVRDLEDQSRS